MMSGNTVRIIINETLLYPEILKNRTALYIMLANSGYLKCIERFRRDDVQWGKLALPNKEIRSLFKQEILDRMTSPGQSDTLYDMLDAMLAGDVRTFEKLLRKILLENVGVHDTGNPEAFYNGLFLGFAVLLAGAYEVMSNGESGDGRFDLAFIPFDVSKTGVILEFKITKDEAKLDDKSAEALKQIEDRKYITILTRRGVKEIWKYGVAFCGKKVKLMRG